jgi:hypothetical protein
LFPSVIVTLFAEGDKTGLSGPSVNKTNIYIYIIYIFNFYI